MSARAPEGRVARPAGPGAGLRPGSDRTRSRSAGDPQWYKDAIIYELHVRAFFDSDGDGIGDFRGLTEKLDYLADLGVTAIWLLPFYPSPLRDDGYDIADYRTVHPSYGTLADVRTLIREAHRRELSVITELVCNHTSDQHPWFQRARRAPKGSAHRQFYVWSDTADRYPDARIIFKDFETSNWTWDPVAEQYFWHRFYSHQPDLNFDNPRVLEAILRVMEFWLDMGVDGLRLDAIPYLIERDGTNGENLPETHAILRQLRRRIDETYGDRMLLAEANQWPEDSVAYFGNGDECHMAFHFPVMPRLFMAIRQEDRLPIVDILAQTPDIPATAQWALFLRNHDELTLEMVTDEERDYMYRTYAADPQARINLGIRRRLAPLLGNNRRRIELMNGLLFSLPGTPIIYYGDEIGMGDNVYLGDRSGVRTPMQWSGDRNAGFSKANRQKLYLPVIVDPEYHYEAVNVEAQQTNPHSLLWWMKRLIALRKRHPAFGRGTFEALAPQDRRVFAFLRRYEGESILVVANLSRYVQWTELDLAVFEGRTPVELFGSVEFPVIGRAPYPITLAPHGFLWLSLVPPAAGGQATQTPPPLERARNLTAQLEGRGGRDVADVLRSWIPRRRWYRGRTRRIRDVHIVDVVPLPVTGEDASLTIAEFTYTQGDPDRYAIVLRMADRMPDDSATIITDLVSAGRHAGWLVDASADADVARALVDAIAGRRRIRGRHGSLVGRPTRALRSMVQAGRTPTTRAIRAEQSNTSVVYGDGAILKLYRVIEAGENPDVEVGRYLTERGYKRVPAVGGWLDHQPADGGAVGSAAVLQRFVPNEGDLWDVAKASVSGYFDTVISGGHDAPGVDTRIAALLAASARPAPTPAAEPVLPRTLEEHPDRHGRSSVPSLVGPFIEMAELAGRRTGELHRVLGAATDDPAFAPEPLTPFHQRSLLQSIRATAAESFRLLEAQRDRLPAGPRDQVDALLALRARVDERLAPLKSTRIGGLRIRCHGDLHAGQILVTSGDLVITDFEAEPIRPLGERRVKRPALTDVAGMIRSLHYAAHGTLIERGDAGDELARWADAWYAESAIAFLRGYRGAVLETDLLPEDEHAVAVLLDALVLGKAAYELRYELSARPDWLAIPLRGISGALSEQAGG